MTTSQTASFKAYIRAAGRTDTIRVFPRSKKVSTFKTLADAERRLVGLKVEGRGIVVPAGCSPDDHAQAFHIAL